MTKKEVLLCEIDEETGYLLGGSPIVHCKDCKWWKTIYSWNGNEHKICVREAYEPSRKAEDFCSYSERIEDGNIS